MRFFLHWSIRTQLLFLIIISVLPAMGIIAYSGIERQSHQIEHTKESTLRMMRTIAGRQLVIEESTRQFLMTLSKMPVVQNMDIKACNALFRQLLPQNQIYANIFFADKNGWVVASAIPTKPHNIAKRKYYRDIIINKHEFSTGEYVIGVSVGSHVFHYAFPVFDKKGSLKGLVAVALNLKSYDKIITEENLPEGSNLALTDHQGKRLYRYPDNDKFDGQQDLPVMIKHMTGSFAEGTFREVGEDGTKRFYAYKKFRLSKDSPVYLYVRLGIPEEQALSGTTYVLLRDMSILVFIFIVALACAWYLGVFLIANPLNKLITITKLFKNGERHITTDLPHRENELGQLAGAFDEMTAVFNKLDSERKKLEEVLQESEEKYRLMVENAREGIMIVQEGRMIFVNSATVDILGFSTEILTSRSFADFIHPDDRNLVVTNHLDRLHGKEMPPVYSFRVVCQDGNIKQVELNAAVITWKDRPATVNFITDITQRTQADEALQKSERHLNDIIDFLPDATLAIDSQKKIIVWNKAIEKMTGIKAVDMIGKGNYEYCIPFYGERRPQLMDLIWDDDQNIIDKYPYVNLDGESRSTQTFCSALYDGRGAHIFAKASPLHDQNGNIAGAIESLRDITDVKLMEKQFLEAQKMEALGVLSGGIAHDFNNILASLLGYTEMAAEEQDESERRHCIEQVLIACDRARDLVQQILAFSRHAESERKLLDLRLIIKESLNLLSSTIPATIEIRRQITNEICPITADATQMHQVMMNLCTNSVHAMGEKGGILEVSLSREEIMTGLTDLKHGCYIKLIVSDSGSGIDPSIRGRIFDPFFTTKKVGEGTGLGLSVVYGIIKNHEGTITVSSEPAKGTTFIVYIPCTEETKPAKASTTSALIPVSKGNERILFVDDDKTLAKLGQRMLLSLGYEVTAFTDSGEALNAFRANPERFDLVITDMTMPHLTGKDLARETMKSRPDMPIILCTGYSEYMNEETALQMGVKALLRKPFTKNDLAKAVREILEKS